MEPMDDQEAETRHEISEEISPIPVEQASSCESS
jgi:hypothetical protein